MLLEACVTAGMYRDVSVTPASSSLTPHPILKKFLIFVMLMYLKLMAIVFPFSGSTNNPVLANRYQNGLKDTFCCCASTQTFTARALCAWHCAKLLMHMVLLNPHYNPVYAHCTDEDTA